MRKSALNLLFVAALCVPLAAVPLRAQDGQTLADIRQELNVLFVEVQKLNRELSTSGGASVQVTGSSALERVGAVESELQRLTAKSEELENRINRIVADGTNRIGDLEFRLVELEGGDVSSLGTTTTLGGAGQTASNTPTTTTSVNTQSLAVAEEADFKRAQEALAQGDFRTAADQFATFNQTYPGGPLASEADLRRGEALNSLGDTREAARAFLAAFSAAPKGVMAPQSLYELGRALGVLGQNQEACVTLSEVALRFPDSPVVPAAQSERSALFCT